MLAEFISQTKEPNEPWNSLIFIFNELDGKSFNKAVCQKITEKTECSCYLHKGHGRTHLSIKVKGNWINIYVADYDKFVTIDLKYIEANNPAYFSARVRRNNERDQCLEQPEKLKEIEEKIKEVKNLISALNTVEKDLFGILSKTPFDVISYLVKNEIEEYSKEIGYKRK